MAQTGKRRMARGARWRAAALPLNLEAASLRYRLGVQVSGVRILYDQLQPANMAYRSLDSAQILNTMHQLTRRIDERFPGAGLAAVAKELLALGRFCATEAETLEKPHWPVRAAIVSLILAVILLSAY